MHGLLVAQLLFLRGLFVGQLLLCAGLVGKAVFYYLCKRKNSIMILEEI